MLPHIPTEVGLREAARHLKEYDVGIVVNSIDIFLDGRIFLEHRCSHRCLGSAATVSLQRQRKHMP